MTTVTKQLKKFELITVPTNHIFEMPQIPVKDSRQLTEILYQIHQQEGNNFQEHFYTLFLNRSNFVTGYYYVSRGGVCATVADPRLILKAATLADCTAIILCHNHPSGGLKPSQADEDLTQKIKNAANYLDIRVVDHIILNENKGYYSFADDGLM